MTAAHATIMYESWLTLEGRVGTVVIPIGAGPMLVGILQGAQRLLRGEKIARLPVPIGVQAAGCAPIARAFAEGRDAVTAWEGECAGIAGSINDPLRGYPADGTRTLRAVRAAQGFVHAVSDDAIRIAMQGLGRVEGIACEPTAAAALAAFRDLHHAHELPRPVVLILSGHVLKDPDILQHLGPIVAMGDESDLRTIIAMAKTHRTSFTG
jgi:threonine synthase